MTQSYKGQRLVPATDRKFHPTDEHLIEENKEEVDQIHHSAKTGPVSKQDRDKFAEIDRDSETKE
ncbi:MAG: hypothetical protein V4529_04960 [Gemmatimonadota bacterium]